MKSIKLLDLDFVPLELAHQEKLELFLKRYPQLISGYTFASLIGWNQTYPYAWTFVEHDTLLVSYYSEKDQRNNLKQPIGRFSQECQQKLLGAMRTEVYPCKISNVSSLFLKQYPHFCSHFETLEDINRANYIYRTEDLATLPGRRYDKKRNLISQAERLYKWDVHALTEKCRPRCCEILMDIGPKTSQEPLELRNERKALEFIMEHFQRLRQKGCLICIDEQPVAFSIFEELTPQMAVVHFEKAKREYKGIYQLINRETARAIFKEGYEFINREEDLGVQGLRQAKSSYFPMELYASHTLIFRK